MSQTLINLAVNDVKRIAKLLKIKPYEVTKALYFKHGGKLTEWELRKLGGLTSIISAHFQDEIITPQNIAMAGHKRSISKKAKEVDRICNSLGGFDYFINQIKEMVSSLPALPLPPKENFKRNKQKIERIVNIVLSDHHIGSDILREETGFSFGKIEESRALACIAKQVAEYKTDKRESTTLNVLMLGDIIENQLHGQTSADLLHLQVCRAIWLYPQLFAYWSRHFKAVKVYFAVGNHGRDKYFHPDRATSLKFNAIETTIYYAIRQALKHYKNIEFVQPLTPWVEFEMFQYKGYATHGDTHFHVGNPGKAINVSKIENQINKINAALNDCDEYKVFVVGHVHQPLVTQLTNGTYLVINGALVPPNAYAQSITVMEAPQVQVLWESTPLHPVGDIRLISIKGSENDQSLDAIIKPFKGIQYV